MNKKKPTPPAEPPDALFGRIVSILEETRSNAVRVVNTNMVTVCWLIGREMVLGVEGGEERAENGKRVVAELYARLRQQKSLQSPRPSALSGLEFFSSANPKALPWAVASRPFGAKPHVAPKGQNAIAQGNALGTQPQTSIQP